MIRKHIAAILIGCCLASCLTGCGKTADTKSNAKVQAAETKTFTLYDLTAKYDPSKVQVLSGSGDGNADTTYIFGADDDTAGMPEMSITAVSGVTAESEDEMQMVTGQTNGTYSDFTTYMFSDAPISGGSYTNQQGEVVNSTFSAFLGMLVPKAETTKTTKGKSYLFILYDGDNPFSEYDYQLYTDCIKSLVGDNAAIRSYREAMEQLTTDDSETAYTESATEDTTEDENVTPIDTKQGDNYVLSASALSDAGREYYIVGKDIPAGNYNVNSTGNGTLEVCDGEMSLITQFQYERKETDTLQDVAFEFTDSETLIVTGDAQITLKPAD